MARSPRESAIAHTMRRFKKRQLHSGKPGKGKGPIVKKRRQAIAIALSEAEKKYGPYVRKTARK